MIFGLVLARCLALVLDWPAGMFNYILVTLTHTSALRVRPRGIVKMRWTHCVTSWGFTRLSF